jgi:hypothetical protein
MKITCICNKSGVHAIYAVAEIIAKKEGKGTEGFHILSICEYICCDGRTLSRSIFTASAKGKLIWLL